MSSKEPHKAGTTTGSSSDSAVAQSLADTAQRRAKEALNAASDTAQSAAAAARSASDAVATGVARALGPSSAEADDHTVELPHSQISKAQKKDVPDRVADHPHMSEAPSIAKGNEKRPSEPGVQDLGWSEDPKVPQPVIQGMRNEDMWLLVRRFNKQTYRLRAFKEQQPPGKLDMNIAADDDFFPDKLRSTLERCYTTVGISMVALSTHIARIRSWKEYQRTTLFALCYLVAWFFNYLVSTFAAFILLIFVSPRSRRILFPPVPLAAISGKGTAKVPKSGHLGSANSATGAAESFKGEAVEQEASNLVSSISTVAVSTAVGKDDPSTDDSYSDSGDDPYEEGAQAKKAEDSIPDPTKVAEVEAQAKVKAEGDKKLQVGDHTAAAVDQSVWGKLHPLLHALEDLCDNWERLSNALSPVPPFPQHRSRLFIASALVLPLLLGSLFIDVDMVYKGTGFSLGFGFFGQPLFDRLKVSSVKQCLDEHYPEWPKLLELRNTLLKGVPTNAQLTVTLLRIAEAAQSPLPPPPPAVAASTPKAAQGNEMIKDVPPEYRKEMRNATEEYEGNSAAQGESDKYSRKSKSKGGSKIVAFCRGTVFAGTATVLGANKAKAAVGSEVSKNRLGVVEKDLQQKARGDGPSSFQARFKGKRGYVDVLTAAATPSVVFEPEWGSRAKAAQKALDAGDKHAGDRDILERALEKARPKAAWSVLVDDIAELRKVGGYGWKGKLVVGWALNSEIADGLEITTVNGERVKFTAMPRRDEVFNRLASLGNQQWEIC